MNQYRIRSPLPSLTTKKDRRKKTGGKRQDEKDRRQGGLRPLYKR